MIQIRNGIFETNSSSSHAIVVTKQDKPADVARDLWLYRDGSLDFYNGSLDFGRSPFDCLSDWHGRLRYAIASYSGDLNTIDKLEEICRRHLPGFHSFYFLKGEHRGIDRGYIDHQSDGLLQRLLEEKSVDLEDFIFNDRYIVFIDGDEYGVLDRMMETPLFNKNEIECEVHA